VASYNPVGEHALIRLNCVVWCTWSTKQLDIGRQLWYLAPKIANNKNVGQCPTWWSPCRIQVAPSVQRRKVWLTPTTRVPCSNTAKMRKPLKFAGCKLANRSQPLVGWSSPYYDDVGELSVFNKFFFRLSIHASAAKIQPDKVVRWCQSGNFLLPVLSLSQVQHIWDMHSKFTLRPHQVWKYGRHPISDRWD